MKAVGFTQYLPIENESAFLDLDIGKPQPEGRDILVNVKAVAINPVDTKVRAPKDKVEEAPRIIGYLVAVMDWHSRKVLSWRLSNSMDAGFCVEALKEALARYGPPEIFNSTRDRSSPAPTSPMYCMTPR